MERRRGLLIVFEGVDRAGKSTQCDMLKNYFINMKDEKTERMSFPGILLYI